MRRHLGKLERAATKEITTANTLLDGLKSEERILMQARYKNGISEDLFDEELARIQRERQAAERVLDSLDLRYDDIERTLDLGLALLDEEIAVLYYKAKDSTRRLMNQAIFQAIWIHDGEITGGQYTPELAAIRAAAGRADTAVPAFAGQPSPQPDSPARTAPSAVVAAIAAPDGEEAPDAMESGASKASVPTRPNSWS